MKTALIGYTGFVGSNLKKQYDFTHFYNSKNFNEMKGEDFDLMVCAGVPAAMWLANQDEKADLDNIRSLTNIIKSTKIKRLVLISTISVYQQGVANQIENEASSFEVTLPYGKNRRITEVELAAAFPQTHILRLPALFGEGLKKNFIFDLINIAPKFLNEAKYNELTEQDKTELIKKNYSFNGKLWECKSDIPSEEFKELQNVFDVLNFSALNFTNSDSMYQFYNMNNIWKDIQYMIDHSLEELNICSPPVKASEIATFLTEKNFENLVPTKQNFNMQTKHGKNPPYLYTKEEVLNDLKEFYKKEKGKL